MKTYLSQSFDLINCTPPWLSGDENLWCFQPLMIEEHMRKNLSSLYRAILDDRAETGECLPSCKSVK